MARYDMPEFVKIYVVAGVVVKQDGKYLLVQEKKPEAHGLWNLPAGRVE
jgi:ADP-ribose pyrophosphatase YjhB (NUDIX family)